VFNRHSFILIRQMAALIRRALVEVCTVPVLLAVTCQTMTAYACHLHRSPTLKSAHYIWWQIPLLEFSHTVLVLEEP